MRLYDVSFIISNVTSAGLTTWFVVGYWRESMIHLLQLFQHI